MFKKSKSRRWLILSGVITLMFLLAVSDHRDQTTSAQKLILNISNNASAELHVAGDNGEQMGERVLASVQPQRQPTSLPTSMTVCHKAECIWPTELTLIGRVGSDGKYEGKDFEGKEAFAELTLFNAGTVEEIVEFIITVPSKGYSGRYRGKLQGDRIVGTYYPSSGFGPSAPFQATISGKTAAEEKAAVEILRGTCGVSLGRIIRVGGKGLFFEMNDMARNDRRDHPVGACDIPLNYTDRVSASEHAVITIELNDGGRATLLGGSTFSTRCPESAASTVWHWMFPRGLGAFFFPSHGGRPLPTKLEVETANTTVSVEGTQFVVDARTSGTEVFVMDGTVKLDPPTSARWQPVLVRPGQGAKATAAGATSPSTVSASEFVKRYPAMFPEQNPASFAPTATIAALARDGRGGGDGGGGGNNNVNACGYTLGSGILNKWRAAGGERGFLGCPTSNESEAGRSPNGTNGRYVLFKEGVIIWHRGGARGGGSFEVHGCIGNLYQGMGGTGSWLGFPVSDEYSVAGGRRSDFEGGYILWNAQTSRCQAYPHDVVDSSPSFTAEDNISINQANIIRFFAMASPSPGQCKTACAGDRNCVAYTFVKPGGYKAGDPPVCYLFSTRGQKAASSCCFSGERR